jgi:hypothetical protein
MTKFQILASITGSDLYPKWANDEISLWNIVVKAFSDGVTFDDDEQPEERLLDRVMGILPNGYILTHDKEEDIIDVWKQVY